MAIVDTIESIKTNLANAYDVAESKGATIPENRNIENLASTIESVQGESGGDYNVDSISNGDGTQTLVITSATSSATMDLYKGLLDGSLEKFKVPAGVTSLASYRFYFFKNLKEVDLTGITNIPDFLCQDAHYVEKLVIDPNTTVIGQSAFNSTGYLVESESANFEFIPNNVCTIKQMGMYRVNVTKVKGIFNELGNYAFSDNVKLKDIDIKVNGSIGTNAFDGCNNVTNFNLVPESVITSLGFRVFQQFGENRESPENNIFKFDFRNSTFTSTAVYLFTGNNTSDRNLYFNIQFPSSLTTLSNYLFRYSDHFNIYFNTPTVPTATSSTFADMTNYKVFVPYNLLNAHKTATNWVTIASNIYGFVNENTLEAGYVLPTTNGEGLTLKWYSDIDMTTEVTAVADTTIKYYCGVVE